LEQPDIREWKHWDMHDSGVAGSEDTMALVMAAAAALTVMAGESANGAHTGGGTHVNGWNHCWRSA
jgi:hypothetical protein